MICIMQASAEQDNGRTVAINLTSKGRLLVEELMPIAVHFEDVAVRDFSESEVSRLKVVFRENLSKPGIDRARNRGYESFSETNAEIVSKPVSIERTCERIICWMGGFRRANHRITPRGIAAHSICVFCRP
jgi:hypothetical protein